MEGRGPERLVTSRYVPFLGKLFATPGKNILVIVYIYIYIAPYTWQYIYTHERICTQRIERDEQTTTTAQSQGIRFRLLGAP